MSRILRSFLTAVVLLGLVVLASGFAPSNIWSRFGPSVTNSSLVTLEGYPKRKVCLLTLEVTSTATYNLHVLSDATTIYTLPNLAPNTLVTRFWDLDHEFCTANGSSMYITVDAGTPTINYQGFSGVY